jgi:hypothetical protein
MLTMLFAVGKQTGHLRARDTARPRNVIHRKGLFRLIEQRHHGEAGLTLPHESSQGRHRTRLRVMRQKQEALGPAGGMLSLAIRHRYRFGLRNFRMN